MAGTVAMGQNSPPTITAQPQNQTVTVGQTATFSVTATGPGTIQYQWKRNGVDLTGETSSSYTTPAVSSGDNGAVYSVAVFNEWGSVLSNGAILTVQTPPSITQQPASQTVTAGQPVTFTVTASGNPSPSYQWRRNGSPISGETGTSYTINSAQVSDNGATFSCLVSNAAGAVTSASATLTVQFAPSITQQPTSQTVSVGQSVTFTVNATGNPSPSYQWRRNGSPISGETGTSYTINSVQASDNGATFDCVASNSVGNATSNSATLTVTGNAPVVSVHPVDQDVAVGASVTFSVTATGNPAPTYQWQKNGVDLAGKTASSLTINGVGLSDAGNYRCVVSNAFGSANSNAATLTVGEPPAITTQPASQSVAVGASASFSVVVSGTAPLNYQWTRDGSPITGETGSTYQIASAQLSDNGAVFACQVSNNYGSVVSADATLTVSNSAPVPVIDTPASGTTYSGGDTINFSGSATDPEDGTLAASALTWRVEKHTTGGTTVIVPDTTGMTSGSFTVDAAQPHAATDFYRIILTAVDSNGSSASTQLDISAKTANLTLSANSSGAKLLVDGVEYTAPATITGVVGIEHLLDAPDQAIGGFWYRFSSWSDAGDAAHTITFPAVNQALAATFQLTADIPKSGWTILSVSSEETFAEDGRAVNAIDGDVNTLWHTQYDNNGAGIATGPHFIEIDLGQTYQINAFRYTPRQDGSDNGRVDDYTLYVSSDPNNWGTPVLSSFLLDTANPQQHAFSPKNGRYVRFEIRGAFDNDPFASTAELDFLQDIPGNQPPSGLIVQPSSNITINLGETVTFRAQASDPENNQPFTYRWTFGASGIPDHFERGEGTSETFTRAFNIPGNHWVFFSVADGYGEMDPSASAVLVTVQASQTQTFISQLGWSVLSVDSEHSGFGAALAIDGDPDTYWHTEFSPNQPPPPHDLQVNLGGSFPISGFQYLPRQDGAPNGNIGEYEFYVSTDGVNWGNPVVAGTFPRGSSAQTVYFPLVTARYVRLRAITEVNGEPFTTVAELRVITPGSGANTAPEGVIDSPAVDATIAAGAAIDLQATATDADGDTPLQHRWTFMPGSLIVDSTQEDPGVVHFDVPGTYTVTYTVTDARGLADPTPDVRTITVEEGTTLIPKTGWSIHYVDSEETQAEDGRAINAIDGNPSTIWHSRYSPGSPDQLPHEIQIDLGQGYDIGGFQYVPRQDDQNGRIKDFRFYVSADGVNWGAPVAADAFSATLNAKTYTFASKQGRYVRLVALTEHGGNPFAAIAELGVIEAPTLTPSVRLVTPTTGQVGTSPNLYVLADASLSAGQGVRFQLDGGQPVDDYDPPYETTFTGLSSATHTVSARIIDAAGQVVNTPGAVDEAQHVGVGDYFVAMGDSITWGDKDNRPEDNSSADGANQGPGYTPILADLLSDSAGRRVLVYNEGIPGTKTIDGVERIAQVLRKHPNARVFLVMYGTNDTGIDPLPSGKGKNPGDAGYEGTYKAYMQRIINEINAAGKTAILAYPPAYIPVDGTRDLRIQELIDVIDELAADPANRIPIAPVDNHTPFAANATITTDPQDTSGWYYDNIHPNGYGYQQMAQIWFNALGGFKAPALVQLSDLTQTYDGTEKSPTATTSPEGLAVDFGFTQGGQATTPINAGSYAVEATVSDFAYEGSASDTFVIEPAPATITFSDLTHVYDGTPKSATVTTVPDGLAVNVTYNGDAALPLNAGSYAVDGTVSDGNHIGTASGTLTIAPATIALSGLNHVYDGTPKPVTVTTTPNGLPVTVTYDGSANPPVNAGSYAVEATAQGGTQNGSASGTLTIAPATVAVTLSNLVQTFDGGAKLPTITTVPAITGYTVTFNGSATPPVNVGTYTVVVTVTDPNYTGSASETMTILGAGSNIALSDLKQAFDGTPKMPTVTTIPAGLAYALSFNGSSEVPSAAGSYTVEATITDPNHTGSISGTFVIYIAPTISAHPADSVVKVGQAVTLAVTAAGVPEVSYQWRHNGADIPGATASSFSIASAQKTDAGSYSVAVTNAGGTVVSNAATVSVYDPISVSQNPQGQTIPAGSSASLSISASGPSLTYQWYIGAKGDTSSPIAGATSATLSTGTLTTTTNYWVRVQSPAETYDSPTATVAVLASQRLFFGTLAGDLGSFGMLLHADGSAIFSAAVPSLQKCIYEETTVDSATGQFSFTAEGLGTVSGTVSGTQVSGTIGSTAFNGTQDDPNGTTMDLAGLYGAIVVNTSNGSVTVITGTDGTAFVLQQMDGACSGIMTTFGADGHIVATLPDGSSVDLTVSASTSRIDGSIVADGVSYSVSGAREGVSVTNKLVNMSINAKVREGDGLMIAGFVINGTGTKRILLRAAGPVLGDFGVQGFLPDTTVEIFQQGATSESVATNDNWSDADNALDILLAGRSLGAFDLPAGSKDSAILIDLPAGSYTAHVKGPNGEVGASLVEIYDADSTTGNASTADLFNISLRGEAGPDSNTVVAGFVVDGDAPKKLLIRAVGPELADFGVQGTLANPLLRLFRAQGADNVLISSNDDWGSDAQTVSEAGAAVSAFDLTAGSKSSAMVIWLEPGVYSAHATSADSTSGIAIVEIYEIP